MQTDHVAEAPETDVLADRPVRLKDVGGQPEAAVWQSWTEAYSAPPEEVEAFQIEGLRTRFRQMVEALPVLGNLAREQGLDDIRSVEDGAPLLFRHNVYKSYPLSMIEKNQFDRLTT